MKILSKDAEIKRLLKEYYFNNTNRTHYYYEKQLQCIYRKIIAFTINSSTKEALVACEGNLDYKKISLI